MRIVEPTGELARLLSRARDAGVVVIHVVVDLEGAIGDEEALHREAALVAMRWIAEGWLPGRDPHIRPEAMRSSPCSIDDFLGPHVDRARRRLIVRGRTSSHRNEHFVAGDPERPETALRGLEPRGYGHALADPPYRVRCAPLALDEIFRGLAGPLLLDVLDRDPPIRAWSTDWCDFFEAGHEWWGSSFWTVQPGPERIVVVAASTTD